MDVIYRCCCGIDVHKKLIVACLRKGGRSELREFGTMTGEIKELAHWLQGAGCEMIAMESTGCTGSRCTTSLSCWTSTPSLSMPRT